MNEHQIIMSGDSVNMTMASDPELQKTQTRRVITYKIKDT